MKDIYTMTTKIVQAFQAIIDLHFGDESDSRKSDLLDGMIDEVLSKEIYKSIGLSCEMV